MYRSKHRLDCNPVLGKMSRTRERAAEMERKLNTIAWNVIAIITTCFCRDTCGNLKDWTFLTIFLSKNSAQIQYCILCRDRSEILKNSL